MHAHSVNLLPLESKREEEERLAYEFTPQSEVLQTSKNLAIEELRNDAWFLIEKNKKKAVHNAFSKDLNRDLLLNSQSYYKLLGTEKMKADVLKVAEGNPDLAKKLDDQDYNQSLKSFANQVLMHAACVKMQGEKGEYFHTDEDYMPVQRISNFFQHKGDWWLKCEYVGLNHSHGSRMDELRASIPGRIQTLFRWDREKGFEFVSYSFSNAFLRDLSLEKRDQIISDEHLAVGIHAAYQEEEDTAIALFKKQGLVAEEAAVRKFKHLRQAGMLQSL